ncbi:MAG: dUTP diphosphatase [Bacteroidota bacterium]
MEIKVINNSGFDLPSYATEASAGKDLRANILADIELLPLERTLIPTGLFFEIPVGYEAQIRPRSGLAFKQGVTVLNSPGTIDADYRGEIKVLLVNLSSEKFIIKSGERIAQVVFAKHEQIQWIESIGLNESKRGDGGFGSTGSL